MLSFPEYCAQWPPVKAKRPTPYCMNLLLVGIRMFLFYFNPVGRDGGSFSA